ncbi:hypothetical protein IV203_011769 [Nitzschia inconspicua]|uniref:Uncharacterized protein n=1 Tax=Nitzschia inconspicua TaxID=303405 RepID=A0A9K3KSY6_9STRA|nr:hypothetical protein IV203_011769 [Nitzschia inconspicua]
MFGIAKNAAQAAQREASRHLSKTGNDMDGDESSQEVNTPSCTRGPHRKMRLLRSSSNISDQLDEMPQHSSSDRSMSTSSEDATSLSTASTTTGEAGLQIYLKDGHVRLGYCYDSNLRNIHPNVFAPSSLQNVVKMGGGGSGVAVFCGTHPELGDIVMKHGGFKDLTELFALATIAEDLKRRGERTNHPDCAKKMQDCLPSFEMIYISPQHILLKKNQDYWTRLKKVIRIGNLLKFNALEQMANSKSISLDDDTLFLTPGRSIRIYERSTAGQYSSKRSVYDDLRIVLDDDTQQRKPSLAFVLGHESMHFLRTSTMELVGLTEYEFLKQIYNELLPIMTDNLFKFTLAQQRIGGPNAKTGNQWLYEKKLTGKLLMNLVTQFCAMVRNLQKLTLPEELDVVEDIRREVQRLENDDSSNPQADKISAMADQFCGNAIKKNFHPTKGRLRFFRRVCKDFREYNLILTSEEKIPARHLGNLMLSGALMSDTFVDASTEPTMMQPHEHFWRNLLARAVDNRKSMSPNALKRIWNSGLADAGIHNLFVSEDELYFFDLGEPTLQSLPGFMTKFLFSFFHTLGMQEDENGEWVRRFVVEGPKLALTPETKELLEEAYDAFEVALDGVITNLFDGDHGLRWLLLQYVTLQLLSDAAFCLQRWEMKGGGRPRHGNHNTGLETWLWRALWDCYVAFDINTAESWFRFEVEHPCFRDSLDSVRFNMRSSIRESDLKTLQEIRRSSLSTSGGTIGRNSAGSSHHQRSPITPQPMPSRNDFAEVSLRDLTLSTYLLRRSISTDSVINGELWEEDEEEEDQSSDDDSAIAAPGVHL